MSGTFTRATRLKRKARLVITGPAKAGKTWAAISLARGLVGPQGRIAAICTEHGSIAKTCAGYFEYDAIEIDDFDARMFIDLIQTAEKDGYDVIVIDSLSHEWSGKGGILEFVDNVTARSRSKNSYTEGWRAGTPLHQSLIEAILASKIHVVATMRAKMDYVMENDASTGKAAPKKVGLAPIQGKEAEYEFDILCRVEHGHLFYVEGSRYREIEGVTLSAESALPPNTKLIELGRKIADWLDNGDEPTSKPERELVKRLKHLFALVEASPETIRTALSKRGAASFDNLTDDQLNEMCGNLERVISKKEADAENEKFLNAWPNNEAATGDAKTEAETEAETVETVAQ